MDKKRFEALDAFRGLCALSVVIFHMRLIGSITELNFFRGSAIFVEFFFALSGFVLVHSYGYRENIRFFESMKSRFFRLYPLHLFMLVVFILLELSKFFAYKYGGFLFNNLPFTAGNALGEIIPNLFLIQSWTPFTDALSFNYPSWSISVEFYMYALFFLTIITFKSYRFLSWVLLFAVSLCLTYIGLTVPTSRALSGVFCFFGGALTYMLYRRVCHIEISTLVASLLEIILVALIVSVVSSKVENRYFALAFLFFSTIFIFSFEKGVLSSFLRLGFFQYIGKLSYSIYMIHAAFLFVLISVAMILQKITGRDIAIMISDIRFLDFGSSLINNLVVLIILFFIVFISGFTYKYIEIKGQKLRFWNSK